VEIGQDTSQSSSEVGTKGLGVRQQKLVAGSSNLGQGSLNSGRKSSIASGHFVKKNSKGHSSAAINMKLYRNHRRTFRTYRPFYIRIGNFYDIKQTTFIQLTSDVVFEAVVNLLLI
jgi:hypothetical protein